MIALFLGLLALAALLVIYLVDGMVTRRRRVLVILWIAAITVFSPILGWTGGFAILAIPLGALIISGLGLLWGIKTLRGGSQIYPYPELTYDSAALVLAGVLALFAATLTAPPAVPNTAMSVSEELAYLYRSDQADRTRGRIFLRPERDRQRLERVLELYNQGKIEQPQDSFYAAMILQHGYLPDHYHIAFLLAGKALAGSVPEAYTLQQAAYQRWKAALAKESR
jgi:hypothetical protein